MKFKLSEDKRFLVLTESTSNEFDQLQYSFTKKLSNWFIIKRKRPYWNCEVSFIDKYGRIPASLWSELKKLAKEFKFPLEIEGIEYLYDKDFDETEFVEWSETFFEESEKKPRDYQIEAAVRVLKFRNCVEEIATSGGKTLIAYMIFRYLLDKKIINKMLYIVPNINLVTQTEEMFYEYESGCGKKPIWKSSSLFGGNKEENENTNIVFGTYQTLVKKDLEFFSKFDAVCTDESHHTRASGIRSILVKCYNTKYKFGMTGTLPPEGSCDSFTVQSYLGPKVYELRSAELIANKNATPVNVVGVELDYLDEDIKKKLYDLRNVSADEKDGVKLLNLEKDLLRENRKRFNYICDTINKSTKNSLVLFADIKNDYGRKIYDWLKENTDKTVYYIDGGTKNDLRDYYKKQMESEEKVIIVASVGVFSEGISINNLHNIFIVESHKSQYIVRQILGRGMRLMPGKEQITVVDFRDNFIYGTHKYHKINYLMKHAKERERIYADKGFPFKSYSVKL